MYIVIEKSKNKKKQKKEKAKKEFMGMLNYPFALRAAAERCYRNFYREPIPTSWKYEMLWGIYKLRLKKKKTEWGKLYYNQALLRTGPHSIPVSFQNQMSGELLRKFKTGNRWQKLWVVFTNFCLFFYKTHEV